MFTVYRREVLMRKPRGNLDLIHRSHRVSAALVLASFSNQLYHFPLLLQSFGVKWRHLGSMRRCRFCMALSCPSTMSSDRVRMYWPCIQETKVSTHHFICSFEKMLMLHCFQLLQLTKQSLKYLRCGCSVVATPPALGVLLLFLTKPLN